MLKPTSSAALVAITLALTSVPVLATADPHPPADPATGPRPSALHLDPGSFPATRAGAARMDFTLDGPGWVVQTVERACGTPACPQLGPAVTRIGKRGVNRGHFIGRVAGRPLRRGAYRLILRGGGVRTSVVFHIVKPGA